MAFLIGGANSAVSEAGIENSLRFNDGDSAYLAITPGAEGDRTKWTISAWVKRGVLGIECGIMGTVETTAAGASGARMCRLKWDDDDNLGIFSDNPDVLKVVASAVHRDPSAWYHIVCACDTTQATNTNRLKFYVNGTQLTSFGTTVWPAEDAETGFGYTHAHRVGWGYGGGTEPLDGYLSDVYFIDGTQYAASDFGETDDDSGIWKPKEDAKDDLTFGTNGFFLEFKESAVGSGTASTIGADTSGNTNHLTSTNIATTDQTTDIPTNNFATLNHLISYPDKQTQTFSEGNTVVSLTDRDFALSSIVVANGKWYCEVKYTDESAQDDAMLGIVKMNDSTDWVNHLGVNEYYFGQNNGSWGIYEADGDVYHNASASGYGNSFTEDDIIMIALDLDNNKLYFGENGTWHNSGDPTSGATGTGAVSIDASSEYAIGFSMADSPAGPRTGEMSFNFGNPAFAISSSQADDAGYGNFEYDVPTGYYALCTKNLAEYG